MVDFTFIKINVSARHPSTRSLPQVVCKNPTARFGRKLAELKCLIKEEEYLIALNKGSAIFNQEKSRTKEAKRKCPGVSHKRKNYLK